MKDFQTRMRRILGVYQTRVRDADLEQAWLRIGICAMAFAYVWYLILLEGRITTGLWMGLFASSGDIVVAAYMIWRLRRSDPPVVALRLLGIVADNTALTIGMAGAGEGGVAMIGVYLWVTIGNGFRFGPRYLLASYWLSIVGFGLQLAVVPFWEQHRVVGAGLFLAGAIVPLYVLVLLIRLTGQKDAAEQLSNAKSRFVANVSHELRTPLTGVFAVYELLRDRKMVDPDRELVSMLGSAINTLKMSVDAVLQMSKLEAGAEKAEKKIFNLWFFVQQLAASVQPQAEAKGLQWEVGIDAEVPFRVRGDPDHLSHVLGNLLNNAFKFTAKGRVSLSVSNAGLDRVRFEVADTGIGIPLDQQENLFERFVQVDSSAKRRFGGTGLGTSIARDLTELMGGTISVRSYPGRGSTFRVELPLIDNAPLTEECEWGSLRRVRVVGSPGPQRSALEESLHKIGLEVVAQSMDDGSATLADPQRDLAVILNMAAEEAAGVCIRCTNNRMANAVPIFVVAPTCTTPQLASLISSGAAGAVNSATPLKTLHGALNSLVHRPEFAKQPTIEVGSTADHPARSLSVLLADDNASNRMLIARMLKNAGHIVTEASRGDQAFDIMAAGGIDIALLDLNMPDMSGHDVIKLFRAASVGAERLPIVVLSADATPAAKQESLDAGANDFLTKPITLRTLVNAIDRLVTGSAVRNSEIDEPVAPEKPIPATNLPQLVDVEQIQTLRRISRGERKFLDQYISAAFSELERAIADLREAARQNHVAEARSALHIIEGTGGSIGAVALVANCRSMRAYISVPSDPDRPDALAELSTTLALTKSAVLAVLHDNRPARSPHVGLSSS